MNSTSLRVHPKALLHFGAIAVLLASTSCRTVEHEPAFAASKAVVRSVVPTLEGSFETVQGVGQFDLQIEWPAATSGFEVFIWRGTEIAKTKRPSTKYLRPQLITSTTDDVGWSTTDDLGGSIATNSASAAHVLSIEIRRTDRGLVESWYAEVDGILDHAVRYKAEFHDIYSGEYQVRPRQPMVGGKIGFSRTGAAHKPTVTYEPGAEPIKITAPSGYSIRSARLWLESTPREDGFDPCMSVRERGIVAKASTVAPGVWVFTEFSPKTDRVFDATTDVRAFVEVSAMAGSGGAPRYWRYVSEPFSDTDPYPIVLEFARIVNPSLSPLP
jgi:hypothetical protein